MNMKNSASDTNEICTSSNEKKKYSLSPFKLAIFSMQFVDMLNFLKQTEGCMNT